MSKGSKRRPTDEEAYGENLEAIFGKRPIKTYSPLDNSGYESCKETDTPRTEAAKNRA